MTVKPFGQLIDRQKGVRRRFQLEPLLPIPSQPSDCQLPIQFDTPLS